MYKRQEFARPGGKPLLLDLHIPDGSGPFPIAILIHGGGFDQGSRSTNVRPLFEPLANAGFAWFSIDYRLAPEAHFPDAMADVNSAIRWVKAHGAEFHLDLGRISIVGESAGGYLVNYAGTHETPETSVAAVVDFYGPVDYGKLALQRRDHPEPVSYTHLDVYKRQEEPFLDLPGGKNFTSNIDELKQALQRLDSRGGTAMRDAIASSIVHIKEHASRDKKVLVVVTDGNDNSSLINLENLEMCIRDSINPGPRYAPAEVRLALSKDALKTNSPTARRMACAMRWTCSSLSITQGPAIKTSGRLFPNKLKSIATRVLRLRPQAGFLALEALLVRGADEGLEERVRFHGFALELGVELAAQEPGVAGDFADLHVGVVGRFAGNAEAGGFQALLILSLIHI